MSPSPLACGMPRETVLIPVVFPDPELYPLNDSFVRELSGFEVVLFGYWETDEDPGAAREAHATEAEAVLYELAAQFSREGVPTETQLHFGPAGEEERTLQEEAAAQGHAAGVLLPNRPTLLRRVLVAVRDETDADRLVELVGGLNPDTTLRVELFHVAETEAGVADAEELLAGMRERLRENGFPDVELSTTVEVSDDPEGSILRRSRDAELVVMGETEQPDVADQVFGPRYEYIGEETSLPVLLALNDQN